MKKFILITLLLITFLFSKGQQGAAIFANWPSTWITYMSTSMDSTVWTLDYIYEVGDGGYAFPENPMYFWGTIKTNKDNNHDFACAISVENDNQSIFVRFVYSPYNIPILLYDFTLQVGDTMFYNYAMIDNTLIQREHYKVVTDTGTIMLDNGEIRRTWTLSSEFVQDDIWVEGIGSITGIGLFNPLIADYVLNGFQYRFEYFCYNDIPIYDPNDCLICSCDINLDINNEKIETFSIFPNPTNGILHIESSINESQSCYIYNSFGQMVLNFQLEKETNQVDVSSFSSGIYFLQGISNEKRYSMKFVKE
jgi:hypothetical protein